MHLPFLDPHYRTSQTVDFNEVLSATLAPVRFKFYPIRATIAWRKARPATLARRAVEVLARLLNMS